jgi:hypothetical protein
MCGGKMFKIRCTEGGCTAEGSWTPCGIHCLSDTDVALLLVPGNWGK